MPAKKSVQDYAAEAEGPAQPIQSVGNNMAWRHRKFAEVFFETRDHETSMRAAGSRAKDLKGMAYVWLNRDDVKRYLLSLEERVTENVIRSASETRDEVHKILDESLKDAREGDPIIGKNGSVVLGPDGKIVRKPNVMAKVKIAEVKGRTVGMFTDVQRIEGEMEGMDDDTLTAFIVSTVHSNPGLCKAMAKIEGVIREVHAADERARGGEGDEGDAAQEAESLSAAPQASGAPEGWRH